MIKLCLELTKPLVTAQHKLGMMTHIYNPSTHEVKLGGSEFKVLFKYTQSLWPVWDTQDPDRQKKKEKETNEQTIAVMIIYNGNTVKKV